MIRVYATKMFEIETIGFVSNPPSNHPAKGSS
jgi:hypothetical protein